MTISGIENIDRKFVLLGPITPIMLENRVRACQTAYANHKKGCPKFGKCPDCPPKARPFEKVYAPGMVRIAVVIFDFESYVKMRRKDQPNWTMKALRNPRHWQGHLRAEMRQQLANIPLADDEKVDTNPEARGINVTATCAAAGLEIEWPPKKFVCQVAMIAKTL